jgi:hypothetical protein
MSNKITVQVGINTIKTAYLVIGVANTGSGSLTFPEDVEMMGVFIEKVLAENYAHRLNDESGMSSKDWNGVTEMVYEVHEVDFFPEGA